VAISDDYGFEAVHSSPKPFTEYSFSAIMVLVALVGSFLIAISQFSLVLFSSFLFTVPLFTGELALTFAWIFWIAVLGLTIAVLIVSIFQVNFAYRLHTQGLHHAKRIIQCSALVVILEISGLILAVFNIFVLLMLYQVFIVILLLNFISFFLMKKEEVQAEFRWAERV
jgi:hypothetical protein